jgi:predicted ATPase
MAEFISRVLVNPRIDVNRSVFPFTLPVFKGFQFLDFHPELTLFIGENGSGKSTLLEAVAVQYGFPAEGGSLAHTYETYDTHSGLHDSIILRRSDYPKDHLFIRAETFYNFSTYTELAAREFGGSPRFGFTHRRSRGQGFLDTVKSLKSPGLYLFDEPESALSLQGQITFLYHMKRLIEGGSQIIMATHSPILMGFGKCTIYHFSEEGIQTKKYRETDHYQLTLEFLRNRGRFAEMLGLDQDVD